METVMTRSIWKQAEAFIDSMDLFCWLDDMEPNLWDMEQFLADSVDVFSEDEFVKLCELTLADYQNHFFG